MKSFRHWTPRYITDRLAEIYYQKTKPHHPWLTKQANLILSTYLQKSDVGLEFGSGRSTVWLAERVQHLTSVEHNQQWHAIVQKMLKDKQIGNVDYRFGAESPADQDPAESDYVKCISDFQTHSLDFTLIDGIYRDYCVRDTLDKIKPGGLVVIDNVNRYLPFETYSPHSRHPGDGPLGQMWGQIQEVFASWRYIWTSSGVTDTAFFFKPPATND